MSIIIGDRSTDAKLKLANLSGVDLPFQRESVTRFLDINCLKDLKYKIALNKIFLISSYGYPTLLMNPTTDECDTS